MLNPSNPSMGVPHVSATTLETTSDKPTDSTAMGSVLAVLNLIPWTQRCLCSFELVFWVPSNIFPKVGSLDQKANPFLIFCDISILLSTVVAPICILTKVQKEFLFSKFLLALFVSFIVDNHSDQCEMIPLYGFNLHFSDD